METIPANINAIQLPSYSVEQQIPHSMLIHLFLGLIAFLLYTVTASLVRGVGCWPDIALNRPLAKEEFTSLLKLRLDLPLIRGETNSLPLIRGGLGWGALYFCKRSNLVIGTILHFLVFGSRQESFLIEKFFFWVPERFFLTKDLTIYSQSTLIVTLILGVLLDAIAGVRVKELDFAATCCCCLLASRVSTPCINAIL
jgi:hypothetical protein